MREIKLSTRLQPLEWQVWQNLRAVLPATTGGQRALLAVSGGLDSTVLCAVMGRLSQRLRFDLHVAHFHHGPSDEIQQRYRDQAQSHVAALAQSSGFTFHTNAVRHRLDPSEASLREARYQWLGEKMRAVEAQFLVLAHHRDDQMETQLLRLIRGTDAEGFLGMHTRAGEKLRPFLHVPRAQLEIYARHNGLQWVCDPSNDETHSLRNWLRQEWLPQLEARVPGGAHRLQASLSALAEMAQERLSDLDLRWEDFGHPAGGLDRCRLSELDVLLQRRVLAQYLRSLGVSNYTRGHLVEILKRLDSRENELTFRVSGLNWTVNAQQISAVQVGKES